MEKIFFGSNLKMYKTAGETAAYLKRLQELTSDLDRERVQLFILPSYTALERAAKTVDQTMVRVGAQNMSWAEEGQFTGEISARMLEEFGLSLSMVGHSERRHTFLETDEEEGKKVAFGISRGFTMLLCVGETAEEKDSGIGREILRKQLILGCRDVKPEDTDKLWIAYEPVWSIGVNGTPASAEYAEEIHGVIRDCLSELFPGRSERIPVLYGGSVNPGNAVELITKPSIDGLFVGRSAWDADKFNSLIRDALKALGEI